MRLEAYILEIFLTQLSVYLVIWLSNDYLGTLLSVTFGGIFLIILLISLITEWVERSRVPRWYYQFMGTGILAPLVSFMIYLTVNKGLDWMVS